MEKVLVLDCWMRKGLSVVRALGREGLEVHASGHKSINPVRFSKYTKKFLLFPNPETHAEDFKKVLLERIKKEKYSCVMPLEEGTIEILYGIRKEIEKYSKLPLVAQDHFEQAVDKWNSVRLATKLGVPAPESYCPQTEAEVKKAIEKIGFPLIIKPRKTSGGRGLKKINTQVEFDAHYPEVVKKYGRPMIQEYIGEGPGVLVWFIIDKKKVLADFSYRRIRKYPIGSGPGTLWISTEDKPLKKYSEMISKALDWKGIIIVEFKVDPKDKKPKFMEINPRLGGSTMQPLFCGVNFPYLMYLLSEGKPFVKPKYAVGKKTRWLMGDIMHFLSNKKRWDMKPSFFDFFDKDTYFEEFDRTDMPGNVGIFINYFLNLFDPEILRIAVFRK